MEYIRNEDFEKQKCRLRWDKETRVWRPTTLPCEYAPRMRVQARACAFNQANFAFLERWNDVRRIPLIYVPLNFDRRYMRW